MPTHILTDQNRAIFAALAAATATSPPGTIVSDFDRLLAYLETDGIPVSPKNAEFALARLPTLNAQLTKPPTLDFVRGRQVSYPHVDALHLLLRMTRLGRLDRSRSSPRMVLDQALYARWQKLNPTERYFTLLDYWWSVSEYDEDWTGFKANRMADYRLRFLEIHAPGKAAKRPDLRTQVAFLDMLGMKQVALMQMFGMLEANQDKGMFDAGWKIARMVATPWGLAACDSYHRAFRYTASGRLEHLLQPEDNEDADDAKVPVGDAPEDDERPAFFSWAEAVIPCFPAWQHFLGEPEPVEPFRGSVTLKVSLDKVWRRILMPSESSFDDLALFILAAFRFDDEHIYQFTYQDQYATNRTLDDPRSDAEDDYADEVKLGEIGPYPKQIIEFRYDFGYDWRFKVQIEVLDAAGADKKPRLIAKEGKAPAQYPSLGQKRLAKRAN